MNSILEKLGIDKNNYGSCFGGENWNKTEDSGIIESINPTTGELIANVYKCSLKRGFRNLVKTVGYHSIENFNLR